MPDISDDPISPLPPPPSEDAAGLVVEAAEAPREVAPCPLDFNGVEILAPMVRASTLPLRLESLRYGASLAFGEEIVDRKIIGAVRVENPAFGTVDFVSPREKSAVFATCAEERSRVFFQLGTADAALATQAALLVCNDVRGVDINMGCPKSFSVKGGMGAALLEKPEVAADILKTLRRNLPASCALTCKIRMLPTTERTRDFMQLCERSGAEAVTLHMRFREERPAHPAHWDEMVKVWDAVKVPVIANGDFFSRHQIDEFWRLCRGAVPGGKPGCEEPAEAAVPQGGPSGVMVARGALWNPSIFCRGERQPPPFEEVVRSYARAAVRANCPYQNTKWVLTQMLAGGTGVVPPAEFRGEPTKLFNRQLGAAKSMAALCQLLGEPFDAAVHPAQAHTTAFYRNFAFSEAPATEADGVAGAAGAGPRKRCSPEEGAAAELVGGGEPGGARKRARAAPGAPGSPPAAQGGEAV